MNSNGTCNSANNGCVGANKSIGCSVTQCAYHCKTENYCSLNKIQVGTHEANPTEVSCTDCQSFKRAPATK